MQSVSGQSICLKSYRLAVWFARTHSYLPAIRSIIFRMKMVKKSQREKTKKSYYYSISIQPKNTKWREKKTLCRDIVYVVHALNLYALNKNKNERIQTCWALVNRKNGQNKNKTERSCFDEKPKLRWKLNSNFESLSWTRENWRKKRV